MVLLHCTSFHNTNLYPMPAPSSIKVAYCRSGGKHILDLYLLEDTTVVAFVHRFFGPLLHTIQLFGH
jgi:hypothetical protein